MKKVILITGGSQGLGRALSERLSESGFVVYSGSRSGVIRNNGLYPRMVKLDITSDADCAGAVKKIISEEGSLDILINNAALSLAGRTEDYTVSEYLRLLDTNTVGAFRLIKEALPQMRNQKGGHIINITSLNGRVALPNFGLYSSSKFALEALGLVLHNELKRYGIQVTNIAPGAISNPNEDIKKLPHKTLRERFWLVKKLMPMVTYEDIFMTVKGIIRDPNPPAQIVLGSDTRLVTFLQRFLPQLFWDKLLLSLWK